MKKVEKLVIYVVIIIMIILSTGCWSRKELKQLGIVGLTAVEKEHGVVKLTFEIIKPKRIESKDRGESVKFYESEGKSIISALVNATTKYDKTPYLSHSNAYILNENVAKEGLNNYLELLNRYPESKRYVHLAVTKDLTASTIIEISKQVEETTSGYIESLYDNNINSGKAISVKLIDYLKSYYEKGIEPVVGMLSKTRYNDINGKSKEDIAISVEGLSMFKGDNLVGFLNGIETRSYNLITSKLKSGIFIIQSPDGGEITTIKALSASSKINVESNKGIIRASLLVTIGGMIIEATGHVDIADEKEIKRIEDEFCQKVKSEIVSTIKKVKKYRTDIFGFGQVMHRKHPKEWNKIKGQWNDIFSQADIDVDVEISIERVGVTNEQLNIKR